MHALVGVEQRLRGVGVGVRVDAREAPGPADEGPRGEGELAGRQAELAEAPVAGVELPEVRVGGWGVVVFAGAVGCVSVLGGVGLWAGGWGGGPGDGGLVVEEDGPDEGGEEEGGAGDEGVWVRGGVAEGGDEDVC